MSKPMLYRDCSPKLLCCVDILFDRCLYISELIILTKTGETHSSTKGKLLTNIFFVISITFISIPSLIGGEKLSIMLSKTPAVISNMN